MNKQKLQPLNGNVILRPVESQEETYGNIVLPDMGKERPEMAEVVAASATYNWHNGDWKTSELKPGQKVLIPKLGAMKITIEGEDFFITKETEILSVVN
jgi:chaperonin GroES